MHLKYKYYPSLLNRIPSAGMLYWRLKDVRTTPLHHFAHHLQLAMFAFTKTTDTDRLFSWTRTCNTFCPLPPERDLPDPSLFSQIRCMGRNVFIIFIDMDNMFHNQRLSSVF